MTSPEGAFFSATDADSLSPEDRMEEGAFFTWSSNEIDRLLGSDMADIVKCFYATASTPLFEGRHILNTPEPFLTQADTLGLEPEQLKAWCCQTHPT